MAELKALGATVITVNIPAFDIYSNTIGASRGATVTNPTPVELANLHAIDPNLNAFPFAYPTTATGGVSSTWSSQVAAYYYEKQIESYNDPQMKNLDDLYNALHDSPSLTTIPGAANNIKALATIYDAGQAAGFGFHTDPTTGQLVADNPAAQQAPQAFADLRNQYYEAFMNDPTNPKWGADAVTIPGITHIDAFTFPTLNWLPFYQGYTGITDPTASTYGSGNLPARFESNILGVPSIAVPMGYAPDGSPMSLEFMGHFDGEGPLIGMAYSYEQATELRVDPIRPGCPTPRTIPCSRARPSSPPHRPSCSARSLSSSSASATLCADASPDRSIDRRLRKGVQKTTIGPDFAEGVRLGKWNFLFAGLEDGTFASDTGPIAGLEPV